MFLCEQVFVVYFQVGIVELDVLASWLWNAWLSQRVMQVLVQALSDLEGICVLAKPPLQLSGNVVGGLAMFTDLEWALQPRGIANLLLWERPLLLIVGALLVLLREPLCDLRSNLLRIGHELLTVQCLHWTKEDNRASLIRVCNMAGYSRIRQHSAGYGKIRQDTAGCGRIRQDTAGYSRIWQNTAGKAGCGRIQQDTAGYGR